jgi:hypothetical protein
LPLTISTSPQPRSLFKDKVGSLCSTILWFALHCSPVRLALRVLNQYEPRNQSRFPFHDCTDSDGGVIDLWPKSPPATPPSGTNLETLVRQWNKSLCVPVRSIRTWFPFSVSVYISSQSGSMWQSRLPAKFPRSG